MGLTLSIMPLRDLAYDPSCPNLPIELSIEENVDIVYKMSFETKSDITVGVRGYDT